MFEKRSHRVPKNIDEEVRKDMFGTADIDLESVGPEGLEAYASEVARIYKENPEEFKSKNSLIERLKRLRFVFPVAVSTFLASCGGDKAPEAVSSDAIKNQREAFMEKSDLVRINLDTLAQAEEGFESIKTKLTGQEGDAFTIGDEYFGVVMNDSTIRVFHQKPDYDYYGKYVETRHGAKDYKVFDNSPKDDDPRVIDTEKGHNVGPGGIREIEETPSNTFELTIGKDLTTLEWGLTNDEAKDAKEQNGDIQAFGKMAIDKETGGIIYFVDNDNLDTKFAMREDGIMVLGEDIKGPEYAKAFFEMKAGELKQVQEEVEKRFK